MQQVDQGGQSQLEFAVICRVFVVLAHELVDHKELDIEVHQNGKRVEESVLVHRHKGRKQMIVVAENIQRTVSLFSKRSSDLLF